MTETRTMPGQGQAAPPLSLPADPDQRVDIADLRGSPVILAFYPADFSPVCTDQMALYQAVMPEFERYDATMLGISVDGVWCHRAFADSRGIAYPLLSDFEPKGEASRRYGVYSEDGVSERALFVLDADGNVAWNYLSPRGVNPGADGILTALEALER
jgi:peroxiredoxin